MIASYPPEFLAFFGGDANSLITPAGFLGMYAFSMMPVIIGIFAVMAGSGLIVSDEERGRLDLIVAHPVGRSSFFFGRSLGILGAALSIMLLGWLGFCVLLGGSSLGFNWGQMAVPFLSLLAQTLVYATLALMLSMFLPSLTWQRWSPGRSWSPATSCRPCPSWTSAWRLCRNSCRITISRSSCPSRS